MLLFNQQRYNNIWKGGIQLLTYGTKLIIELKSTKYQKQIFNHLPSTTYRAKIKLKFKNQKENFIMTNLKKKLAKIITIALAAVTVSSIGVMGAGAYKNYGNASTAYASKSGYSFYKYGASRTSGTTISHISGKDRFVIPQIMIMKKNQAGNYGIVEYSQSGPGVLSKGKYRTAFITQVENRRQYWHRGVLKEDTSYSSAAYHVFSYKLEF